LAVVGFCGLVDWYARAIPDNLELLGLLHPDLLVYYSCGRQSFDEQSFLYSSPYSHDPASPRVYTHLLFLLAGILTHALHIPIYIVDQVGRLVGGVLMLWIALCVFRRMLPPVVRNSLAAVLGGVVLVCGGGLAWLIATANLLTDTMLLWSQDGLPSSVAQFLFHEFPEYMVQARSGYWGWGATLLPTIPSVFECGYHLLFFGAILLTLTRRYGVAALFLALTWWSHPFTGIELGFILSAFGAVEVAWAVRARCRATVALTFLGATALTNIGFLAYYGLYLPSFPEHRSVQQQMMAHSYPMLLSFVVPAYGLLPFMLLPGAYYFVSRKWLARSPDRLAATWLLCVLVLMFHDRLLPVKFQPLHFSRGYLSLPLLYFAVRVLSSWHMNAVPAQRAKIAAATATLLLLHLPDSITLYTDCAKALRKYEYPFVIQRSEMQTVSALAEIRPCMTIYAPYWGWQQRSLIPLLTCHRTLGAHLFNVPHYTEQLETLSVDGPFPLESLVNRWKVEALLLPREAESDIPGTQRKPAGPWMDLVLLNPRK